MRTIFAIIAITLTARSLPAVAQAQRAVVIEEAAERVSPSASSPVPPPTIEWTDDWFDADTYPSLKSAALNLGVRWGREAARRLDSQVRTIEVHAKRNIPVGVAHEVRTGIASMVHGTTVEVAGDECRGSSAVHCVSLTLQDHDDHSRLGVRRAGTFRVDSPDYAVQANFAEKAWAENFGEFANARPKQNWLIGRSKDPCLSESEARDGAIAAATEHLFSIVRQRVRAGGGHWGRQDDDRLRDRIRYELSTNVSLVPDRFLQRASRPYGGVFRQAVLVDASRPNLDHLIMLSRRQAVEQRQSFARTLISAAALFFVVYLLYLFVNSMTRGYFVWSLRMVAVSVLVLGIIVLLMLG